MKRAASRVSRFIAKWATTFIGKYLENVSEDSFELGLNSGKLQLKNVKIKEGFIEQLNIPVKVTHGFIETINISIPYGNILRPGSSSPLVVEIDDLSLSAKFIGEEKFDTNKIENFLIMERLRLIEHWNIRFMTELAEDEYFTLKGKRNLGGSKPFISRIVSVLIQDVRLKFRRIHIVMEDIVNKDSYCGLVLNSLEVCSIPNLEQVLVNGKSSETNPSDKDEPGPGLISYYEEQLDLVKELFDTRTECSNSKLFEPFFRKDDSNDFSYRLLDLNGFSIYSGTKKANERLENNTIGEQSPVIHPFCCKLLLRQRKDLFGTSTKPIYTIYGVLEEIYVTLSEQIVTQCGNFLKHIQIFNKYIEIGKQSLERKFLYRPSVPVHNNAKLWWKYAVGCIIRRRKESIGGGVIGTNNSSSSNLFIRLQEEFIEAKILMYCREYTQKFHDYFDNNMKNTPMNSFFDGGLFNDLLLDFSRQHSEYYLTRIPFSRFVSLHTSLVHQYVGKKLEIHLYRRKSDQMETLSGGITTGNWIQWLFNLHRISSPNNEGEIFYDASEESNELLLESSYSSLSNEKMEQTNPNESIEFDESYFFSKGAENGCIIESEDDSKFYDCNSDEFEYCGLFDSNINEYEGSIQKKGVNYSINNNLSLTTKLFGVNSDVPFIVFRVLLRETKLEVIIGDERGNCISKSVPEITDEGKNVLLGKLKNFGLEYIQSDSRLSILSLLEEFVLDYSSSNGDIYHLIYADNSKTSSSNNMWFTFYYLSRISSICSIPQNSSRRRSSLSQSSDFSIDKTISAKIENSFQDNKTIIKINVEKCYMNIYSHIISIIVGFTDKYKFIRSDTNVKKKIKKEHKSTESNNGGMFLIDSSIMDVDIQIETPILIFCHENDNKEMMYGVISFGKISISNNENFAVKDVIDESGLELQNSKQEGSFDYQSVGSKTNMVSPYYRYVLSENVIYWFKCIHHQSYFVRIEEIYVCIYKNIQPSFFIKESRELNFKDNDEYKEYRADKINVDSSNSYRLFSIDFIDIRFNLLSYKKYNMVDETWIKYIKLFSVLTQLDPLSTELFDEKSFMSLVLSTNSVYLDSKPSKFGNSEEFQLEDNLQIVYSSIQINKITSNFNPALYQSLYKTVVRWIQDSRLDKYFVFNNNITREKEFKMFKLGLNIQFSWYIQLNNLFFDLVSEKKSIISLKTNNIQILYFIYDHHNNLNTSIGDLSFNYLLNDGINKDDSIIPLLYIGHFCNFICFPTTQFHFITREFGKASLSGNRDSNLINSFISNDTRIKFDSESIVLYLRPLVIYEIVNIINTLLPKTTYNDNNNNFNSIMVINHKNNSRCSFLGDIKSFELIAFQKDTQFLKINFCNTISMYEKDTQKEIDINIKSLELYNIYNETDICFLDFKSNIVDKDEYDCTSSYLKIRIISHEAKDLLNDIIHKNIRNLISTSEMLVEAQNISMVLFLDIFLHNIYYFGNIMDNVQFLLDSSEDRNKDEMEVVSVPLRDVVVKNSKIIIPCGTLESNSRDTKGIMLNFDLFNFNNKYLIYDSGEHRVCVLMFRLLNIELEYINNLISQNGLTHFNNYEYGIVMGFIPDFNFHIRKYQSDDEKSGSFDMSCFVESKSIKTWLNLSPKTLSALIDVFTNNLLKYDDYALKLNDISCGTLSDQNFINCLNKNSLKVKKYIKQVFNCKYLGKPLLEFQGRMIERIYFIEYDDTIQPSHSINIFFPSMKLRLVNECRFLNDKEENILATINMDEINVFFTKFIQKKIFMFNLCIMSFKLEDRNNFYLSILNNDNCENKVCVENTKTSIEILLNDHYFTVLDKKSYIEKYFSYTKNNADSESYPLEVFYYYSFGDKNDELKNNEYNVNNLGDKVYYANWKLNINSPKLRVDSRMKALSNMYKWYSDYCSINNMKAKTKSKDIPTIEEENLIVDKILNIKRSNFTLLHDNNAINIKSSYELSYVTKKEYCLGDIPKPNNEANLRVVVMDSYLKFNIQGFEELSIWEKFELQIIYNVVSDINIEGKHGKVRKSTKIVTLPNTIYIYNPHFHRIYEILEYCQNNVNFILCRGNSVEISKINNGKNLALLSPFNYIESSINIIIQNSKFILLNSIDGYTNVPLSMLSIQSNDLLAVFNDGKLADPTFVVSNGDLKFWVLNPKHGYYEPVIEECNFNLKYDKCSQVDNYSPKGKTLGRITKKLNMNFPTVLSINSSPILLKTLTKHYYYWENHFISPNNGFRQFEPLKIINKTGYDIKIIGYNNFESYNDNLNNSFSLVLVKNEKKSVYKYNNCLQSMSVFLLDILIGELDTTNEKNEIDKYCLSENTFKTIFKINKVVNIDRCGFFALPIKALDNNKSKFLLCENPYLFFNIEDDINDLGIQKVITISSQVELHNELDFYLEIALNENGNNLNQVIRCNENTSIPIITSKSDNDNNIYYRGLKTGNMVEKDTDFNINEYDIFPLFNVFNNREEYRSNSNAYVEKKEKRYIYHSSYHECNIYSESGLPSNRVGFYIVIEGKNYIFKSVVYHKYYVKFKPLLTLISTLPVNLYYRVTNIELMENLDERNNISGEVLLPSQKQVLSFGIIDYLSAKKLYVPLDKNSDRIEKFKFELGLLRNNEDINNNFIVFWSNDIDLSKSIKLGYWKNQNIIIGNNKNNFALNLGNNNIVNGKDHSNNNSFFSVYNVNSINDNYPNGCTLSWLLHSSYWFDFLGSKIMSPKQIVLPGFLPFDSNLYYYYTNSNWLNSKENVFKHNSDFPLEHTTFPLIKKNKTAKNNMVILIINNVQYCLELGSIGNSILFEGGSGDSNINVNEKCIKVRDKFMDINFNVLHKENKLGLKLSDNIQLGLIVKHILLFPKSVIYNRSSYSVEIESNRNYIINSNTILPIIPKYCINSNKGELTNDNSHLLSMRIKSRRYPCFYLNKNKSWKILLMDEDIDNEINRKYLLITSNYSEVLNFELLLITERGVNDINKGLYDLNTNSIYIYNISGRDLYISQKSNNSNVQFSNNNRINKNDTNINIKEQYFPKNTVLEFIWVNNFDPREIYIHDGNDNSNLINIDSEHQDSHIKGIKRKYISIYNMNKKSINSQFEVYNFGLLDKKHWIIYRICRFDRNNNYILCLLSYNHFMDWYSNRGLTKKALSLLQSSTRPSSYSSSLLLSPSSANNDRKSYICGGITPSTSLNRFSIYNNAFMSSKNYVIDVYSSKVILSAIWDNNINKNPEELFLIVFDTIYCKYSFCTYKTSPHDLQISLGNLKIDVQYRDTIYPVLLQRLPSSSSRTLNTLERKFLDSNGWSDFTSIIPNNHNKHLVNNDKLLLPIFIISCNFNFDDIISGNLSTIDSCNDNEYEDKNGRSKSEDSNFGSDNYFVDNYLYEIKDYINDSEINYPFSVNLIFKNENKFKNTKSNHRSNNNIRIVTINYLLTRLMGINICFDTHFIYTLTMFINQIKDIFDDKVTSDNSNDVGNEDSNEDYDEYNIIDKKDIIKQFSIKHSITDKIFIKNFKIYPMVIHLTFNLNMLKSYFTSPSTTTSPLIQSSNNHNHNLLKNLNITKILEQFAHNFGMIFSSLIRSITTIEDAPLWINQFELIKSENLTKIMEKIRKHYEHELYSQLYVIATSLGSVGNPVNSFTNIGAGIGDLFYEPIYAVTSGRSDYNTNSNNASGNVTTSSSTSNFANNIGTTNNGVNTILNSSSNNANNINVVTGVKKGIESFMNHSVFGTFQAISKVAGTASQIAGALTMDEKYMEERRRFVHGQQPKDLMDGLTIGAQAFGKSVTDGLSSLVGELVDGATTGNPNSLALGLTKGLVAAVVKPITGVLDFTQKAAQGIQKASTVDRIGNTDRTRIPRIFYSKHHILVPYSRYHSFLFGLIKNIEDNNKNSNNKSDISGGVNQRDNNGRVLNGILHISTVFCDESRIAVVTNESFMVLKNKDEKISQEPDSYNNIIIDYYVKLENIQYIVTGTLIKTVSSSSNVNRNAGIYSEIFGSPRYKNISNHYLKNNRDITNVRNNLDINSFSVSGSKEEKIKVCDSIFDNSNNKGCFNTKLIKGYGYVLKVEDIYPKPCNEIEDGMFNEIISNNKLMFEIIMQMQNHCEIAPPSQQQSIITLSNNDKVLLSPRKKKLGNNNSLGSYNLNNRGSEIPSMIIITHPKTPLPHYKWIECNQRSDLCKLKNILCSLI
ncbi:hypothetical protein FG379_001990 [Cryptosporidium bovis]|uniref:uncharacterized protein n=1 Tax=Cryptosporidium bovis TaxID=310047 RepID=UPI00351A264B|nr:hypothetical protein FG379_001990 [Cryptosporidium bovis]